MGSNSSHVQQSNSDCRTAPRVNDSGVNDGAVLNCELLEFKKTDEMKEFPLNKAVVQEIELRNDNKSESITFRFENRIVEGLSLTFDPLAGKVGPSKEKKIKVKLVVKKRLNINYSLMFLVNGSSAHFFTVRIRCEDGLFGVDPAGLDFSDDGPYSVPTILVKLKEALINQEGLVSEGIFRLAGDVKVVNDYKQKMNKGDFSMPSDVNAIATLIKIWFRELPVPLLNGVPKEVILKCDEGDVEASVSYLQDNLGKIPFDLFNWLLDLLIETAVNRHLNKMTAQNLAIVVAPNLYEPNATTDPIESLILSQKAVQFVHNVLSYKIKQKEAALGTSLDTEFQTKELESRIITKKEGEEENNNEGDVQEDNNNEEEENEENNNEEEGEGEGENNNGTVEQKNNNTFEDGDEKSDDEKDERNSKKKSSAKKSKKTVDGGSTDKKRRKSSAGEKGGDIPPPPSASSPAKKERKHRKTYAAGGSSSSSIPPPPPPLVAEVPPPSTPPTAGEEEPPPPPPRPRPSQQQQQEVEEGESGGESPQLKKGSKSKKGITTQNSLSDEGAGEEKKKHKKKKK